MNSRPPCVQERSWLHASPCGGAGAAAAGSGFRDAVYAVVRQVPAGSVTTYGDVAAMLGHPRLARQVGFALAALLGSTTDVPWHRVINARGAISFRGDDLRGATQRARLQREGIRFGAAGRVEDFVRVRARFSLGEGGHGD